MAALSLPSPVPLHPRPCPPRGHGARVLRVLGFAGGFAGSAWALSHRGIALAASARKKHRDKGHPVDPVAKAKEVMEALEKKEEAGDEDVSTCFHMFQHMFLPSPLFSCALIPDLKNPQVFGLWSLCGAPPPTRKGNLRRRRSIQPIAEKWPRRRIWLSWGLECRLRGTPQKKQHRLTKRSCTG